MPSSKVQDLDARMRKNRLKLLIGFLVTGYFAYATCFYAIPRLYREWTHAGQFAPVLNARIIEARCTNWDFVLFNECRVRAALPSGEVMTIEDWRFGSAPTGTVRLVGAAAEPPIYSTDVSIRTLWARLAFTAVTSMVLVAFTGLCFVGLVRGFRK
jgi:hypothetical protein